MAVRRLLYITALGIGLVFFTAYQEWLSWLLLLVILGLPVLSLVVSLPAMLGFRAEPVVPAAARMGIRVDTRLTGWCRLPVPPFRGRLRICRSITGQQWQIKSGAALPTDHCGGLTAAPEKVWVYDYLGLIGIPVRNKETKTVIVRPVPVAIHQLPDLDRFLARSWRPKFGGGYAENHELRLYRPGDSLNQVHWKLSAKTGKLILREPMQPERGLVLVTMNLRGTPEELDRKFGRLLWLGNHLLEKEAAFEIRVLTGQGILCYGVETQQTLMKAVGELLCAAPAEGDLRERNFRASWQYHIGGEPDET
jgi:uncharacterized protein (DUF58 family)